MQSNFSGIQDGLLHLISPPFAVDKQVLVTSLKILGTIALQFEDSAASVVTEVSMTSRNQCAEQQLVLMHDLQVPNVSSCVMPVLAAVLAKYPTMGEEVVMMLGPLDVLIKMDSQALRSLIWLYGEFPGGHCTGVFSFLIEKIFTVKNITQPVLEDNCLPICLSKDLLTACCKILFKDPDAIKLVFAELLHNVSTPIIIISCQMKKVEDKLGLDVNERVRTVTWLLTERKDLLEKLYGVKALEDQKKRITEDVAAKNRLAFLNCSRPYPCSVSSLNGVSFFAKMPIDNLIPFGRQYIA